VKRGAYLAKLPSTLENVLAQRRLGDEKDSLLVLNDLARSIAAASELETLVQRAAAAATDLLKVDISMLWLRHGHELTPTAWVGIEDAAAERLRLTPDEGLLRLAAADRRVTVADFGPGGEGPETAALLRPTATLAVSLVTGGRVVGLLAVASRSPRIFAAAEERLLTILSDHTAIALENVRLYQELKDRLAALHRAQAQLLQTEKVAAMGQLLAGVAHELSSPLSVVTGRASLLYEQLAGTPPADQAAKIVDAAARCGRIVTNFLALARQHPPERESVRLNQVVRDALELLAYQLRVDSVQVHLDLADELPVLWADGHQLHQVIVNLISNAYQAMRESPGPRRLAISTRHDLRAARVALEVTDNGPGIPAEIQRRIFEPFFTTKPADQGTGLGLSLCQGVVEAHEGSIGLTSQPGAGTTFRIELPVKDRPTLPAEAEPMATPAPVTGKTILVVDDEAVIATMLADMLSADGHVVHTAPNGRVALQKLTEQRYDLVLSDVRMPELDGPGLWRELERTQPALLRRFIFLTGDALNRQTMEFLEGAGAHKLGKPAMLADVHRVTQEVLRVPVPDAESPERG
jgi:two-component system NtrC family sensor kinase